jgi:hypothetical protein
VQRGKKLLLDKKNASKRIAQEGILSQFFINLKSGPDVRIFKVFSLKKSAKMAFLTPNKAKLF